MTVSPISHLAEEAVATSSFCNCSWKDLVTIAVAIAGVVASIFAESMLALVGFTLFGILFLVKKYETTSRISELESQIKKTLIEEEEHLNLAADEIENQVHQVEKERDAFKQNIEELRLENVRLLGIEAGLREEGAKLSEQNTILDQEKEELAQILEGEKTNTRQMKDDVQAIIAENLAFGKATGLFQENVQALGAAKEQLEEQLRRLKQDVNSDIKTLAQQLQMAKETSKLLGDSSREKSELLEKTLRELRENGDQRKGIDGQLRVDLAALDEARRQIEAKTRELTEKENELRTWETKIEQMRTTFLSDVQKNNEEQKREMKETAKLLEEMVTRKQKLLAELDAKILAKTRQLVV